MEIKEGKKYIIVGHGAPYFIGEVVTIVRVDKRPNYMREVLLIRQNGDKHLENMPFLKNATLNYSKLHLLFFTEEEKC